ncbi:RNA polymerase sigma-70 factor [Flaviaesturariibacter terrae]
MLRDLSTSALLQRIVAGSDTAAYKELFLRYYDRLVGFAAHITHNGCMAEEVVSDVFLRLWVNRTMLAHVVNPNLYIYTCVRNASLNALGRERRHAHLPEEHSRDIAAGAASDPEHLLLGREAGVRIHTIVNALPPQCRLILRLVKEEGLRHREVADLLGISVKTVEAQMTIALRRINQQLFPAGAPSLN